MANFPDPYWPLKKYFESFTCGLQADAGIQGSDFKVNVVNRLKDKTMERTTGIVGAPATNLTSAGLQFHSIGTVSFKRNRTLTRVRTITMGHQWWPNAPLFLGNTTSTASLSLNRYAESLVFASPLTHLFTYQTGTFWYHAHVSTQYCDGLRGPLVLYDPEDPHKHLYDVDDGEQ